MKKLIKIFAMLTTLCPLGGAQSFNTIYTFPNLSAGWQPDGPLYIGAGGVLYGTTDLGGSCSQYPTGCGTVYSVTPPAQSGDAWTESVLYDFVQTGGTGPGSGVLPGPNGSLYGTATTGGPVVQPCHAGCGTFFQLVPPTETGGNWTEQTLLNFLGVDNFPLGLVAGDNSVFFGVATYGGKKEGCALGCGSIYELEPPAETGGSWTRVPIHQFDGGAEGFQPNSPLVAGAGGVLYGSTFYGGSSKCLCGTVYSLTPPVAPATAWTFQVIYRFHGGLDGVYASDGLAIGSDGTLYGTTYAGGGTGCGGSGCGTVFSVTPPAVPGGSSSEAVLYIFQGGNDGLRPFSEGAGLAIGPGGVLYGGTDQGGGTGCGGPGCGVLFQLSPPANPGGAWTESILHTFTGGADGQNPTFAPAVDPSGVLYGTAQGGAGTSCQGAGCGVIFQYIP